MKRKLFVSIAVALGFLIIAALISASIWPVLNSVETGVTPAYPDALPMYYSTDPARVFDEVKSTTDAIEEWTLVSSNQESRIVKATRSTLLGWQDDIEIRVEPETEFVTRVHIKSSSQTGTGDFGQNARNIHQFFDELNRRLGAVRFIPGEEKQ